MTKFELKPKNLILGLLQAVKGRSVPIRTLTQAGLLFGFESNTIRVNVARLVSAGVIESDERGFYRVLYSTSPVSQYIDNWRLGAKRCVKWKNDWLSCLLPNSIPTKSLHKSQKSLTFLGFREGAPSLWVRPDNLRFSQPQRLAILKHSGLDERAVLFQAREFEQQVLDQWKNYLWPTNDLLADYEATYTKLQRSKQRLLKLPVDQALTESFLIGSEVIHILVGDPLLPEEMADSTLRLKLTQLMIDYDKIGQQVWLKKFADFKVDLTPVHLRLTK